MLFDEGNSKLLAADSHGLHTSVFSLTMLSKDNTETVVYFRCQRRTQKDGRLEEA